MKHVYENKENIYYRNVREDLIYLLPNNPDQKVLEIGAGGGNTILEIKRRGLAREVIGCDIFEFPDSFQSDPAIDRFIIANLESDKLNLLEESIDVILAGDVLEHLVDPWKVIENLTVFLKRGGIFIVSVPNIRELKTISKIFFGGEFNYNPAGGIMDKTHLRFFCKKNVGDLFDEKVYNKLKVLPIYGVIPRPGGKIQLFDKLTFNFFEEFNATQYVGVFQKK